MQPPIDDTTMPSGAPLAERTIPIVQEEAFVTKRLIDAEQVRVHSSVVEERAIVRDHVSREHVEVTHIPIEREVAEAPRVREVDGVTIVPVLEERLIVEKRLFLVEEIHIRRTVKAEEIALPTTLRRTRIEVERTDLINKQEDN